LFDGVHLSERNLLFQGDVGRGSESGSDGVWWCVAGDWKLILPNPVNKKIPTKPDRKIEPELYQITTVPLETTNLAKEKAEKMSDLRARLDAWWTAEP
jgi:hypothetical protein